MKKMNNKGFSLVELIVVVAIMAVLMTILAPQYLKYVEKSRAQKDASAAEEIRHAVEIAIADETVYNDLGLVVAEGATSAETKVIVKDVTDFSYNVADKGTKLIDELKGTFGKSQVDFTSTEYNGKTYEITIKYTVATKAVTVEGEFK